MSAAPSPTRMPGLDVLKALASQFIVLHHFAVYGPLSDALATVAPGVSLWLYDYGRMAVHVFLVVSGFLVARVTPPRPDAPPERPFRAIARRYVRLALPFGAALLLAVACSALADAWMDDDAIPAAPTLAQVLAHLVLLQDVLGFDSLTSGAWYIPIDFQLFALTALLYAAGRRTVVVQALVVALASASVLVFNRDPSLDVWAIYFFGSYGLGMVARWLSVPGRDTPWTAVLLAVAVASLALHFRPRLAIATTVALALVAAGRTGLLARWPRSRVVAFLGRISFSLFLVHPPLCWAANAVYVRLGIGSETAGVAFLACAWAASIALATLLHRFVEGPAARLRLPGARPG